MKIFANSNYTKIESNRCFPPENPYIFNFGSILNSYLTTQKSWNDENGWKYYDTSAKKNDNNKKDLWLYSANKKKFMIYLREKNVYKRTSKKSK